jgi:hypothetical protein
MGTLAAMNTNRIVNLQQRAALLYADARGSFERIDYTLACQLQQRAARMAYRARVTFLDQSQ